jgi:hypothetical protein
MTATAVPNRIGTGFSLSMVDRLLRKRLWIRLRSKRSTFRKRICPSVTVSAWSAHVAGSNACYRPNRTPEACAT